MEQKTKITVDGKPFEADKGATVLEALKAMGVHVPTLCHHPSLKPSGACRLCVVEITHPDWKGWSGLVTSCLYPAEAGLVVSTQSRRVKETRRTLLELYLANCPDAEEVRRIALSEGVDDSPFPRKDGADLCVLCGLCTQVCQELGPAAIAPLGRGTDKKVGPRPDLTGEDCTGCGACAHVCPTGEIQMERKDGKFHIWNREFEIHLCSVEPELCQGEKCGECLKVCPLDVPVFETTEAGASVSRIDPCACTGCGICAGACPRGAIQQEGCPSTRLSGLELDPDSLKGRVVVFACSRSPLPDETEAVIRVSCVGRVSVDNMLECLARGADGVLLICRDQATCPSGQGGKLAQERAKMADELAVSAGMDPGRIMCLKPGPGYGWPKEAMAAFKASLDPTPLDQCYARPEDAFTGMDHALEIVHWLKRRPKLKRARPADSRPEKASGPEWIDSEAYKHWPELKRSSAVGFQTKRAGPHVSWFLPGLALFAALGKRKMVQIVSVILLHSSFWNWAQAKWLCNPVLSCHSCPLAWFACPIGVFVHYSGYHLFPYVALGTVLLTGVLFARLLCGWACPFGFLQDLLYKIPTFKLALPVWTSNVKYVVLILMVFTLPFFLGEQTFLSFCRICPAAALQSTIPQLISQGAQVLQAAAVVKLAFLLFFLVLSTLNNRAFCRVFCPMGALLAPLNLISFWKIKPPTQSCTSCDWCDIACPSQITPSSKISNGVSPTRAMDCVFCYKCTNTCPMAEEVDLRKQRWVDPRKK